MRKRDVSIRIYVTQWIVLTFRVTIVWRHSCLTSWWEKESLKDKAMRNWEIYAIPCYVEFRNSGWQKYNGNKLYFHKPRITWKFNGNFNGITEFLLLTELPEITRKFQKETDITVKYKQRPSMMDVTYMTDVGTDVSLNGTHCPTQGQWRRWWSGW